MTLWVADPLCDTAPHRSGLQRRAREHPVHPTYSQQCFSANYLNANKPVYVRFNQKNEESNSTWRSCMGFKMLQKNTSRMLNIKHHQTISTCMMVVCAQFLKKSGPDDQYPLQPTNAVGSNHGFILFSVEGIASSRGSQMNLRWQPGIQRKGHSKKWA